MKVSHIGFLFCCRRNLHREGYPPKDGVLCHFELAAEASKERSMLFWSSLGSLTLVCLNRWSSQNMLSLPFPPPLGCAFCGNKAQTQALSWWRVGAQTGGAPTGVCWVLPVSLVLWFRLDAWSLNLWSFVRRISFQIAISCIFSFGLWLDSGVRLHIFLSLPSCLKIWGWHLDLNIKKMLSQNFL